MSRHRVKSYYETQGYMSDTETHVIYAIHNVSTDFTEVFEYDEIHDEIYPMSHVFQDWSIHGKDKWDVLKLVMEPFNEEVRGGIRGGVEYWDDEDRRRFIKSGISW